jgi:Helitron helicase-like domain at N-terminus
MHIQNQRQYDNSHQEQRETYNSEHRESINLRQNEYNNNNRDSIITRQREYNANNREIINARQHAYNNINRDVITRRQVFRERENSIHVNERQVQRYRLRNSGQSHIGNMDNECPYCGALMFKGEQTQSRSFELCCSHGTVVLPPFRQPPARLLELFNSPNRGDTRNFWNNIRRYNSAISLGSIHANVFEFSNDGPPSYRVNGIMSHRIGPIHPEIGVPARFLQVYFLGDSSMIPRDDYFADLNQELLAELRGLQSTHNQLLRNLIRIYDEVQANNNMDEIRDVVLSIVSPNRHVDRRTHNLPSAVEVAAFVPDINYDNDNVHIRILNRQGGVRYISHLHRDYDSICYPMFYIYGEAGYEHKAILLTRRTDSGKQNSDDNCDEQDIHAQDTYENTNSHRFGHNAFLLNHRQRNSRIRRNRSRLGNDSNNNFTDRIPVAPAILQSNNDNDESDNDSLPENIPDDIREHGRSEGVDNRRDARGPRKFVTAAQHYSYRIMQRANDTNLFLKGKKLFQQFVCDMYIKIESIGMLFYRNNQDKLRAEEYDVYRNALNSNSLPSGIGKPVILPSSFTGGPRNQGQLYQDNMAIVRKFGKVNKCLYYVSLFYANIIFQPDLFITMTANPEWDEIKNSLLIDQKPEDRPDLVTRVFWLKFKETRHKIIHGELFGKVQSFVWVIEWQKVFLKTMKFYKLML